MLSERLERRFWLARTWFALSCVYAVSFILAALFIFTTTGPENASYQRAFIFNSGVLALLWVALIIARPKPTRARSRSVFVALEYLLVGLIFSLALILFLHHGWHIATTAPAGFAAIAWGIGWIAAWLGPAVIGILALLFGHWVWVSVFIDYRSACWRIVEEEYTATLLSELEQELQVDGFLREKDAQYVGKKLIRWQMTTPRKIFELSLPSSGVHLQGHIQSDEHLEQSLLSLEKRSATKREQVLQHITVPWPEQDSEDVRKS